MRKNTICALLSAACLMTLIGCKKPADSKANPTSKTSKVTTSVSREPTKELTFEAVKLESVNSVVSLVLEGSIANYSADEAKFALGLQTITTGNSPTLGDFVYGKETPEAADFTVAPTIADGKFTAKFNLTAITALTAGFFQIYAGTADSYATLGQISEANKVKDSTYSYYIRQDEQVASNVTLVLDQLPPIALEEASVFKHTDDRIFAKVGGAKKDEITLDVLNAKTPFIQLQVVGGNWTTTRISSTDDYFWTVEGDKAYINFNINFVSAGTNYNTHLNLNEAVQADAKMDNDINDTYVYNGKQINVYCNTKANTGDQNEFWGNLAFKVTTADSGATEGKQAA